MTGRRSTRAGSKDPTPAPAATPRRTTRRAGSATGTPLPAVNTRESTSYGSSVAVLPLPIQRYSDEKDLATTLAEILKPVKESIQARQQHQTTGEGPNPSLLHATVPVTPAAPQTAPSGGVAETPQRGRGRGSRRGNATVSTVSTPGPNTSISFQTESGVFGDATFNSNAGTAIPPTPEQSDPTPRAAPARLPTVKEVPANIHSPEPESTQSVNDHWETLHRQARARREAERRAARPWYAKINELCHDLYDIFVYIFGFIASVFLNLFVRFPVNTVRWFKRHPSALVLLAFVALSVRAVEWPSFDATAMRIRISYLDFKHNIQQVIPHALTNPLNYFNEDDVLDLQKRMKAAENDITWLKKRSSLDQESIQHLEKVLPDFVVFKRNKRGEKEIPSEFWLALRNKIMQDANLMKESVNTPDPKAASNAQLNVAQVKKIAAGAWAEFLDQNEARIRAWQEDGFDDMWSKHLKDSFKNDVLIQKSELIKMVRQNWEDSKALVAAEVGKLAKKIDRDLLDANLHSGQHDTMNAEQVEAISSKVFKNLIPNIQLRALTDVKLQQNINHALRRVNHFSVGAGAVVNPRFTSPTYPQAHQRAGRFKRALLVMTRQPLSAPNPPVEALRKWDEQGDCWCSPSQGYGKTSQLAVLMSHAIYPDEVVIEHIPSEATLDNGSTPREMELFAKIEDWNSQGSLGEMSDRLFPGERRDADSSLDASWERIGTWTYEKNADVHIQAFKPQLDMKSFNVSTRQLLVRAKNNWGESDHTCFYRVRIHGDVAT